MQGPDKGAVREKRSRAATAAPQERGPTLTLTLAPPLTLVAAPQERACEIAGPRLVSVFRVRVRARVRVRVRAFHLATAS